MTPIQIETKFEKGHGWINFNPALDGMGQAIVHDAGVVGITGIIDDIRRPEECLAALSFERTSEAKLEEDKQTVADELGRAGLSVLIVQKESRPEEPQPPPPPKRFRFAIGGLAVKNRLQSILPL